MKTALEQEAAESERTLMAQARNGDRGAFGQLVERHMRRAYYLALGLVGSHDDALDLSQEAFARAYRARRSLDPERPFYPWLYQIIRRLCFNHLRDRRTRMRRMREATPWLVDLAGTQGVGTDPARAAERSELCRHVARAIQALPEHEREVVVLREFEGLRYREIAELIGIPIGTVMSRLYSARRNLARSLEGVL